MKNQVCVSGKRNCPSEDCGGPWGFKDLLDVMRNRTIVKMTWSPISI
ncbi:MAG: plasmid pRiA4b ORF-3 family protein [bacterium]|nr:plasmid pRiA4b ORF-3 family protein [bacterium]